MMNYFSEWLLNGFREGYALSRNPFYHDVVNRIELSPETIPYRANCFQGFSCCDASQRNEGGLSSVLALPKLASEQGEDGAETEGAAASQQGFYRFWLKLPRRYHHCNLNRLRGK